MIDTAFPTSSPSRRAARFEPSLDHFGLPSAGSADPQGRGQLPVGIPLPDRPVTYLEPLRQPVHINAVHRQFSLPSETLASHPFEALGWSLAFFFRGFLPRNGKKFRIVPKS
jgi:hypothetical protein